MYNAKIENALKFAYSHKETIYQTYNSSIDLIKNSVNGDFVECGIAAGAQIVAMQVAITELNSSKKIFGFDSFEGIPMAGEYDTLQAGIGEITHDKFAPLSERLVSSGITVHSKQSVINNFSNMSLPMYNVNLIQGWFQNTLPVYADNIGSICMLRLDGDLYESNFVCLEYLYKKVSKGGIIIIDDYALDGCRIALENYFKFIDEPYPNVINLEGGGGVTYFYK